MEGPLVFRWSGEAMEPLRHFAREADSRYVIGETYAMDEVQEASSKSRGHYFALIREGWLNLPEEEAERFPTTEALRKYALIRAGYRDERSIVCATKAEALRVAAFVRPMDPYAVVTVSEVVVRVWTAQSQSRRAMGKADFQASKDAVLEIISAMLDVTPAQLQEEVA